MCSVHVCWTNRPSCSTLRSLPQPPSSSRPCYSPLDIQQIDAWSRVIVPPSFKPLPRLLDTSRRGPPGGGCCRDVPLVGPWDDSHDVTSPEACRSSMSCATSISARSRYIFPSLGTEPRRGTHHMGIAGKIHLRPSIPLPRRTATPW